MRKMKTLTVNGVTYAIEDGDSATLLTAQIAADSMTCSHTSGQIYSHIQAGGVAVADCLSEYFPLLACSANEAVFGNTLVVGSTATTAQFRVDSQGKVTIGSASGGGGASVTVDKTLTLSGAAADAKVVGDKLGDVDSALDSIIAMQNALIGGEAE